MLWNLLTIAIAVYAGLCLVFLVFQRSFIYMPTPVTPAHAVAFTLEFGKFREDFERAVQEAGWKFVFEIA